MSIQNIVLSPNAPPSAGILYDISQEYPNDPFFTWFRWINYPWQFSGGVGRIALPNDPVVPAIGG